MKNQLEDRTLIIGHKNPDTDSICSAIAYSYLKNQLGDATKYVPRRAGEVNEETKFVLDYFHQEAPQLQKSVETQVKDAPVLTGTGVNREISLKKAWELMQEKKETTLAVVDENQKLEGVITINDIAKSYMKILDNTILSKAGTSYASIAQTLDGKFVAGDEHGVFSKGKTLIAASGAEHLKESMEEGDLIILGDEVQCQKEAVDHHAACLIICDGAKIGQEIIDQAKAKNIVVIAVEHDLFTTVRLMNQSLPIGYFMTTKDLDTFTLEDDLIEVKEVMAGVRHRDFPVLDAEGKFVGMFSRRCLLNAKGKKIILVDHNEKTQAVDGMEHANLREVIDHHRMGTVETVGPIYYRAQPLGCTATIVYQMFKENGVEIPKEIAGLMCSAIISDTLLFRSPTCTPVDKEVGMELAKIAGIDVNAYANDMFAAGSNLKKMTDEQIFHQDYKQFALGKMTIGIGQISSLNADELVTLEKRLLPYLEGVVAEGEESMIFFMLTNILEESTSLLCVGEGAEALIEKAFALEGKDDVIRRTQMIYLPGVVSRKKQLVPALVVSV